MLIKPNQAGTLTETKAALDAAREAGSAHIVSARSGESEDVTIVPSRRRLGRDQLKVGSFARSERMAKWNEGLRIAEALGERAAGVTGAAEPLWKARRREQGPENGRHCAFPALAKGGPARN